MKFSILFLMLAFAHTSNAQSVKLNYTGLYLNEVLLDLNQRYDVQVSIDAKKASACLVNISADFKSIDDALNALADNCGLKVTKIGNVFTFSTATVETTIPDKPIKKKKPQFLYQGEILDATTNEPLPYARIIIGSKMILSDENGKFSLKSFNEREEFQLKYLGYVITKTTIKAGSGIQIKLNPKMLSLNPVVVENIPSIHHSSTGDEIGRMKFNDITTSFIPGNSSNLIFNHLRLYPGVMASGEATSHFIVWGSYIGQNQLIFDGITLYNSIGFNDDIGRVNPLIIKNMDLFKGGYNVQVGDRIGGILLIDSKHGSRDSLLGKISINNQVLSTSFSFPLFKKTSTLQLSARKSYYNLVDFKKHFASDEKFIDPSYTFADINLKLTSKFKNGDQLFISSIGSADTYSEFLNTKMDLEFYKELEVQSHNIGSALKYVRSWKKGGISTVNISHSHFFSTLTSSLGFKDMDSLSLKEFGFNKWTNNMREYAGKIVHSFASQKGHHIQFSSGYVRNECDFILDSVDNTIKNSSEYIDRLTFYAKDNVQFTKSFQLQFGLKIDMPISTMKPYVQPRIDGKWQLSKKLNLNFGWGIYNQFVSKTLLIDQLGNQSSFWQTMDGKNAPILSAMHNVLGISYLGEFFEAGIEGYYKTTKGISRFYANVDSSSALFSEGIAQAYGADVFLKKRWKNHEFWLSYSLGKVEEQFAQTSNSYVPAPHNQLHELKTAALFNFHPFYFSISNVYGSGFSNTVGGSSLATNQPYHRLDASFQYKFNVRKTKLETGISVLNIFNYDNVRLNQYAAFPDGSITSTSGIPFTPTLFFNLAF